LDLGNRSSLLSCFPFLRKQFAASEPSSCWHHKARWLTPHSRCNNPTREEEVHTGLTKANRLSQEEVPRTTKHGEELLEPLKRWSFRPSHLCAVFRSANLSASFHTPPSAATFGEGFYQKVVGLPQTGNPLHSHKCLSLHLSRHTFLAL
jgi:hypothetical protein